MADLSSKLFNDLLPQSMDDKDAGKKARHAAWRVNVQGVDVTKEIHHNLLSLEVTDNEEDEADDLQIKIADRDGEWLQKWLNDTIQQGAKTNGLKFEIWIGITDADGKVTKQKCGTFYLDCVKHSGPPAVTTIKCISLAFGGGIRSEKRDKAWEKYNLSGIAGEIAGKAGLKIQYLADSDPFYARKQQDQETDLEFLMRLCKEEAMSLKFSDNKMVIFDKKKFEAKMPSRNFIFNSSHCEYLKWDLGTTAAEEQYDSCLVKYTDPKTGECIEGRYKSDEYATNDSDKHRELVITDKKVSSVGEAMHLAEKLLKINNQFAKEASFTVMGDPTLMAGLTAHLSKFGYWNGKYIISRAKHTIGPSGYTTRIDLRKV